jgi:hypothetical protein
LTQSIGEDIIKVKHNSKRFEDEEKVSINISYSEREQSGSPARKKMVKRASKKLPKQFVRASR